ncbi:MAG: sigma-54-dependent Fis family transcriptional regulator, partial [Nitrospirota bacterium]|nr:sigma-54-dependent Fis family transcriptional regulator [Nitrospirota bacterium]
GETGTGKELLAQAIHDASPRRAKPFVRINCAAMPAGLVESELFGHERGAFSGADQRKAGRFELADGGTLFLDEVGELPLDAQAKLLRVLQDGVVDRVGGTKPLKVDVRIVAATNANLPALIAQRQFRSDLFYRLNVFPITIPPLRQRPEDIPVLVGHFLRLFGDKLKRPPLEMEPTSLQRLIRYDWPGNVRELQNVIERACILTRTSPVTIEEGVFGPASSPDRPDTATRLDSVERAHLCRVLAECQWKIEGRDGAAARLGLLPSTLRSRLKKHRIQRPAQL